MDFEKKLNSYLGEIEKALENYLPSQDCLHSEVIKAMSYSLLDAGKRIRPVLVLEFCRVCSGDYNNAMPFACALEMIHTYSLIHDDLPCLDNDDLRRGKPSCHKVFGEDMALLAGDALLNLAFETALGTTADIPNAQLAAYTLAKASGTCGMIGGQVIDVKSEGQTISMDVLREMHSKKTGALILAAAQMGCIIGGNDNAALAAASDYAINLGISFQIVDDILDAVGDEQLLGKPIGSDAENGKSTYVTLLGLEEARKQAGIYSEKALSALKYFGDQSQFLVELTNMLLKRDN